VQFRGDVSKLEQVGPGPGFKQGIARGSQIILRDESSSEIREGLSDDTIGNKEKIGVVSPGGMNLGDCARSHVVVHLQRTMVSCGGPSLLLTFDRIQP
jgi:hypothetical protein